MEYNQAPISLREGHVYLDGVEIADSISAKSSLHRTFGQDGSLES